MGCGCNNKSAVYKKIAPNIIKKGFKAKAELVINNPKPPKKHRKVFL